MSNPNTNLDELKKWATAADDIALQIKLMELNDQVEWLSQYKDAAVDVLLLDPEAISAYEPRIKELCAYEEQQRIVFNEIMERQLLTEVKIPTDSTS